MIRANEEAEAHVSSKLDAFTRFKKSVNFLRLTPKGFISLVLVLLQPLVRTPRAPHRAKWGVQKSSLHFCLTTRLKNIKENEVARVSFVVYWEHREQRRHLTKGILKKDALGVTERNVVCVLKSFGHKQVTRQVWLILVHLKRWEVDQLMLYPKTFLVTKH